MFRYPPYHLLTLLCAMLSIGVSASHDIDPQGFVINKGQILDQNNEPNQLVVAAWFSPEMDVLLNQDGFSYQVKRTDLPTSSEDDIAFAPVTHVHRVDISFEGMSPNVRMIFDQPFTSVENFIRQGQGKDVYDVRHYRRIVYQNLYDGIDLEFVFNDDMSGVTPVKFNFILQHASDISMIRMKYAGQNEMSLDALREDGPAQINISTSLGEFKETVPHSYLFKGSSSAEVDVRYLLNEDQVTFGFTDPSLNKSSDRLIIDPTPSVTWGSYFGGNGSEQGLAAQLDGTGFLYIGGITNSSSGVATSGVYQSTYGGGVVNDMFICCFDLNGVRQWSTYFGSTGDDQLMDLTCDNSGNVYFVGSSTSSSSISTSGAYQTTNGGASDAVIGKFNNSGVLQWCTYLGGSLNEVANGVTFKGSDIYVAGTTSSTTGISTAGSYQTAFGGGGSDGFMVRLSASGALIWSSYFGGPGADILEEVILDGANNLIMAGYTNSSTSIATAGAFQTAFSGINDGMILSFTTTGLRQWSTYLGGAQTDQVLALAINATDQIVVAGSTLSSTGIATAGAHDVAIGGAADAFMMIFDNAGNRTYGTYFGGSGSDVAYGLKVDAADQIYVVGNTASTSSISTTGAHQTTFGGGTADGFLAQFSSTGVLNWSTYYGGSGNDYIRSIDVDPVQGAFSMGFTNSSSGISTTGSHQTGLSSAGVTDAFFVKFNSLNALPVTILSFNAIPLWDENAVDCQWHVASELSCNSYIIDKSVDGLTWSTLEQLACGSGLNEAVYAIRDENPAEGTSYYRLSELDAMGAVVQSRIAAVLFRETNGLVLFPNPASEVLNVVVPYEREQWLRFEIMDSQGKCLFSSGVNSPGKSSLMSLDLGDIPAGQYVLRIIREDGQTESRNFIRF